MRKLYKKIEKKCYGLVKNIVPWNTNLRPHSFCNLEPDLTYSNNSNELIVHSIYPDCVTTLDIAEDLYNACSAYWKPKREITTSYIVTEIPNGRVYTDNENSVAVISKRNRLIDNVSLSLKDGKVVDTGFNNIFEQKHFVKPVKFKGTVFTMLTGGAGINNISHWFIDVLPRLHLLHKAGLYNQVDWFLVPSLQFDFQREALSMLGIPASKLIAGDKYPHITADTIIATTAPRGNHTLVPKWLCTYLRDTFLPYTMESKDEEESNLRLYISRSDSKVRHVSNENAVVAELSKHGFQSIILSKLSVVEKIKLFSRADAIVGATGAGLVHTLFCKPGTKVIELFSEGFIVEPFFDIATKIHLDYDYIISSTTKAARSFSIGQRKNLRVDISKLASKISLLNNKTQLQVTV